MKARGYARGGARWLRVVCMTVLVFALCVPVAVAGKTPTAWSWPVTTSYFDHLGAPFTPTLQPDPTGVRKGLVFELEFDRCGYNLYVTNGPELFYFEQGKDYAVLFDVLETPECGHNGEFDVRVVSAVPSTGYVAKAQGTVGTVPDGVWRTEVVYLRDFAGPSGDYYLHLYDQCGQGCWMIGDVRVTGGGGHK